MAQAFGQSQAGPFHGYGGPDGLDDFIGADARAAGKRHGAECIGKVSRLDDLSDDLAGALEEPYAANEDVDEPQRQCGEDERRPERASRGLRL